MSDTLCPLCSSSEMQSFFKMDDVPVHCNLLWSDAESARECPRGDIHLAYCNKCGFITNICFDEKLTSYSQQYNNSLFFSPIFKGYAEDSVSELIEKYDLHQKTIIEIGSGQGDFLLLLCRRGHNWGIGFDPAFDGKNSAGAVNDHVLFIQDMYLEKYSHYKADLFCCRHVLEHIQHPRTLLSAIKKSTDAQSNTALYLQVPNSSYTLSELAVWDIIYEHCSYFTPSSLSHTLVDSGFIIEEQREEFDNQYLSVFAQSGNGGVHKNSLGNHQRLSNSILTTFQKQATNLIEDWNNRLRTFQAQGMRTVMWGAGSKGISFLNMVDMGKFISAIVDINPQKQGGFVPGTGQRIISPRDLVTVKPDVVIVANPIYTSEVNSQLENLTLDAQVMSL